MIIWTVENKRNFSDNPTHNILERFNNFAKVWITTHKMILVIYSNYLGAQFVSGDAKKN